MHASLGPLSNHLYCLSCHFMPFTPSKTRPLLLPPSKKQCHEEDILGLLEFQSCSCYAAIVIWFAISKLLPVPSPMLQPHCSSGFPFFVPALSLTHRPYVLFLISFWAIPLAFQCKGQWPCWLLLRRTDASSVLCAFPGEIWVNNWSAQTGHQPQTKEMFPCMSCFVTQIFIEAIYPV